MEHQEFVQKMYEVAAALGMVFELSYPENKDNFGKMKGEPANFWISNSRWKQENRISISSLWPIDNKNQTCIPYNPGNLEITIADSSSVDKIVSAIQKRFLPKYLFQYAKAMSLKKDHDAYDDNKSKNAARLAEYFMVEIHDNGNIYPLYTETEKGLIPYTIEVNNQAAKFRLDISIENAIKVFDLLKTL